jgi:predicted SnoaL-like aldol condensation-catalyzing enzyme
MGGRPLRRREKSGHQERRNVVARGLFANWHFIAQTAFIVLAVIASGVEAPDTAPAQSQGRNVTNSDMLGTKARQAVIDIFRKKDVTAVDRYFGDPFTQHDPNLADGLAGMKSFAAEIASSPNANVNIYRTLVDEDFVLLHSIYEGVARYGGSAIAFDLFRFNDGKIVEHWGGQEPQAPPNLSGRSQVDGPSEIVDREKTEDNRTLVRTYRETVMVSLRFDRIGDFIDDAHYAQHASKIGDGIARLRDRIASVAKEGGQLYLTPRRFVADGNFVLVLTEGDLPSGPTALYDLFRVENGKIVEHWDVLTPIPPRDQWKNANGPF